jgi:hypothetical protein
VPIQPRVFVDQEWPMDLRTVLSTLIQSAEVSALSQTEPNASAQLPVPVEPANPQSTSGSADVYHGSDTPASPSLLSRTGISAYTQLVSALSDGDVQEKSANQLASNLTSASVSLKSSYDQAVTGLPPPLQRKDWGFSVFNGELVFVQGQDELTPEDVAALRRAFSSSTVGPAAKQVAGTITSIGLMRKSGADVGPVVWGQFEVDETNFSDIINLRCYVTATVPGGNYDPKAPSSPRSQPGIPTVLGGMYLGNLISAQPEFLDSHGAVKTAAEEPAAPGAIPETQLGTLQGQCSCGEVRFAVQDTFEYAFYCHCSRCRIRTGSAFAAIAGIGTDKLEVVSGREQLLIEGECSDGYGARCGRCHTFLFAAVRGRQYIHVALGVLRGTPSRLPDHHIYVGSKAPWYQITDGLPQYLELP